MTSVFEKIQAYNEGLLSTKVARKYELISENPFRFLRGTNHLFYEDLSKAELPWSPECWICGDLHLENFGSYKADNRLVYFDLNDFDESVLAPVSWELTRILTSILVAFDAYKITDEEALKSCEIFLAKYSKVLADGKPSYIETRTAKAITKKFLRSVENRPQKDLFEGRTIMKKGKLRLNHDHVKLLLVDKESKTKLLESFASWLGSDQGSPDNYKVLDVNFRLAGTGSVGIKRYVFLIEKNDEYGKYMLIDMKQATASSLEPYVKTVQPTWRSEAERMVTVQRMMQNVAPARLGMLNFEGDSYLMQEMQPTKDRINFKIIQDNFKCLCSVLEDMAMLTASAHLRTVGRKNSCTADALMDFGKSLDWQKSILSYAINYKEKIIIDYAAFKSQYRAMSNRKKVRA